MWDARCEKKLVVLCLLNEFSDFKFFSHDNSVLYQIITLQDLRGIYQNCHFFGIHTTFQLTSNVLNKQFYDEIFLI